MKKIKDWEKAKALYGMGKSLREIERETGIPYKTIHNRIKKESWDGTKVAQAVASGVKAVEDLAQLSTAQVDTVTKEIEKIAKARGLFSDVAEIGAKLIGKMYKEMAVSGDIRVKDIRDGSAALKDLMHPAGLVDFQKIEQQPQPQQPVVINVVGAKKNG